MALVFWLSGVPLEAQSPPSGQMGIQQREDTAARARQVADEQVSLSADKIIVMLHDESGLLLAVKKRLVILAYEQGRLLDLDELDDESLFRLVRESTAIRVIVTREIEARSYIRARPTEHELAAEKSDRRSKDGTEEALRLAPGSEKEYWAARSKLEQQREETRQKTLQQQIEKSQPQPAPEPTQPDLNNGDARRRVLRAEAQQDRDLDSYSSVAPADLPSVLAEGTIPTSAGNAGGEVLAAERVRPELRPRVGELTSPNPESSEVASADIPRSPAAPRSSTPYAKPNYSRPEILRQANPYANIPALYDLYAQVSGPNRPLDRFGADLFQNGTGNFENLPIDLPVGPEYVLGPGDTLKIEMWGGVSQRLQRVVDREGRISLPEVGAILAAGHKLGDLQREVQDLLRTEFRDVRADISLARIRSVRVYVVGDVARPGAYDVSALSTPLNAVYAAGGSSSRGSIRTIQHYRGKQLVQQVDVYDLLLHGVRSDIDGLQPGDTVLVPPQGAEVTVEGMVRRPAIYELRDETRLAQILELAGGVLPSAALRHIDVERLQAHEKRVMLSLDIPEGNGSANVDKALQEFAIQDGDRIRISPIVPYSERTVFLDGHVFHPGKYAYRDGMKLTDVIKSYQDLLPEPALLHAEIIRLNAPDYSPEVLSFNLKNALAQTDVPALKPFDTIRIFGRYDFEDAPKLTIVGEVRFPGDHLTNGATRVRDAIYLAGGVTPDALLDDAQIIRKSNHAEVQVLDLNLRKALAGDEKENILLVPADRLIIHRNLARLDPPAVSIQGEVANPGKYPLASDMTAADLVRIAGGFKRSAYTETADLSRYVLENRKSIIGEHHEIAIGRAMAGEPDTNLRLFDGDVLTIGQLSGWNNVGASIAVRGEVGHPGTYGVQPGERLSSILLRAGGLSPNAYPFGAVLERAQVREFDEKNRQEMIRRLESGDSIRVSSNVTGQEQAAILQAAMQQQQQVLNALRTQPATGRLVVHLTADINRWENTINDIEVRAGDILTIPKRPTFVLVSGQVYRASAVSFVPGKHVAWYLAQAGGPTSLADRKGIFVVRADGSVAGPGSGSGFWDSSVMGRTLQSGDTIVVPEKFIGGSSVWKDMMAVAQFATSVAIAARVATSF